MERDGKVIENNPRRREEAKINLRFWTFTIDGMGMSYFFVSLSHGDHLEYNKIPI